MVLQRVICCMTPFPPGPGFGAFLSPGDVFQTCGVADRADKGIVPLVNAMGYVRGQDQFIARLRLPDSPGRADGPGGQCSGRARRGRLWHGMDGKFWRQRVDQTACVPRHENAVISLIAADLTALSQRILPGREPDAGVGRWYCLAIDGTVARGKCAVGSLGQMSLDLLSRLGKCLGLPGRKRAAGWSVRSTAGQAECRQADDPPGDNGRAIGTGGRLCPMGVAEPSGYRDECTCGCHSVTITPRRA